uniref:Integrase catalytic domain-containing protein n=1 Tax=Tanacetum cinerariifolium TaxID=118510 RepID=A0A699KGV9_TANCI|nr:hypothetical protein [Tanacetum cinerariifolium]
MDLFGPTIVKSLNKKSYCLVVTDDYSRKPSLKVKVIRSDNGTEFKNNDLNQFCEMKGIKREFSVARTPQQNGIVKRKNRTLIEAVRTMLEDSLLPIPFWAEAANTTCYVQNREKAAVHEYQLLPFISSNPPFSSTIQSSDVNVSDQPGDVNAGDQPGDVNAGDIQGDVNEISRNDDVCQGNEIIIDSSTRDVNAASTSINSASNIITDGSLNINTADSNHTNMPTLDATCIFDSAFDDRDLGAEADINNLDSSTVVNHIPTTRVHKDHPKEQIIRDPNLSTQTRIMIYFSKETAMALKDPSWIEAMQEEILQLKL